MDENERWTMYYRYPYLLAKMAVFGVGLLVVYLLLKALEGVLAPVLGALVFAYLIDPMVDRLEARGWTRTKAIGLLLLAAGLFTAGFAFVLLPTIVEVLHKFTNDAPQLVEQVDLWLLGYVGPAISDPPPERLINLTGELGSQVGQFLPQLAGQVGQWSTVALEHAATFTSSLFNLVLMPFFAFYFLRDFDEMKSAVYELIPPAHREAWVAGARRADAVVGAWFRGQVEVAVILGMLYAVGLGACFSYTDIGWVSGVAVGVLAGGLNFIPYVGTGIGLLLTFGLLVLDGAAVGVVIGAAFTFGLVQTLEGYVITPQVVGDKVGLSTLAVILALAVGAELFGLAGMLLSLPAAGVCMAFWPDMRTMYIQSRFFRGE